MSYPTSRRFSRTLAQAFPREHAQAITHYRGRFDWLGAAVLIVACVAVGVLVGVTSF